MLPLTKQELKAYQEAKVCYICGKGILEKFANDKNYWNVRDVFHYTVKYRGAAHNICNLKFNVPNDVSVVFHRGSNYDYHFIMKDITNEFEGKFECLGENKEKDETFLVLVKKEGNEKVKIMFSKIKPIDSGRFMAHLLSNLIHNLTEEIQKIKCKDCGCFVEYESVKDNLIKYKC